MDAAVRHHLNPGDRVSWSGGRLLTKTEYADWLAETAGQMIKKYQ
jgi:hypothetical protein